MAVALVATLLTVGAAQAATFEWMGGVDTWRGLAAGGGGGAPGDVWLVNGVGPLQSSVGAFGDSNGWEFADAGAPVDPTVIIDGPGSQVFFDQSIGAGGQRDFRFRPQTSGIAGRMTVSGGASFSMTSDDTADPDGQWTQFNGELLTVTGPGSLVRKAFGGSGFPNNQSAGKFQLRGIRSEDTGTVNVLITDGGRIEVDGGQFNFGDFGEDHIDSTVMVTIDGKGSLDARGGGQFDFLAGILGGGGNGSIMLFRGWDPTAAGGTGGITDEDYSFNFAGHGGTMTVDEAGILVVQQIGPDGAADYDFGSLLTPVSYEQLWDGLDRGAAGASIEDVPAGTLKYTPTALPAVSGATGAVFGDYFITTGTLSGGVGSGSGDYTLVNIRGAIAGGDMPGDINGDMAVNAVDAGTMFANWGSGPATVAQGNIDGGPDDINAVDAGLLFANWTTDPGPAGPGQAIADYDPNTGEIIVSIEGVNNWFIQSASGGLTGDEPNLTTIPGSLPTNDDSIIGETAFGVATATSVVLGNVAAPGLALGDLTISWNAGLGIPLQTAVVQFVPEPATLVLAAFGLCGVLATRRRVSTQRVA